MLRVLPLYRALLSAICRFLKADIGQSLRDSCNSTLPRDMLNKRLGKIRPFGASTAKRLTPERVSFPVKGRYRGFHCKYTASSDEDSRTGSASSVKNPRETSLTSRLDFIAAMALVLVFIR